MPQSSTHKKHHAFFVRQRLIVDAGIKYYQSIMANTNLGNAKQAKNDEFYTQFTDISNEMLCYTDYNPDVFRDKTILLPCDDPEWSAFTKFFVLKFNALGLKKLISTSYAPDSKKYKMIYEPTLFEKNAPQYDADKSRSHGKIFILDRDECGDRKISINDIRWQYLDGDGDFKSSEVTALRDESDFIITNPPFSLLREFINWIMAGKKKFIIVGTMNAISYKDVFPLLMGNKIWLGGGFENGNAYFCVPDQAHDYADGVYDEETGMVKFRNCCWYTNVELGKRHTPSSLMTVARNLKYSHHSELKGRSEYQRYDNYDAIEVPFVDAIPSDYKGIMGVPISFFDKYCPEQFVVVGITKTWFDGYKTKVYPEQIQVDKHGKRKKVSKLNDGAALLLDAPLNGETYYEVGGKLYEQKYARILIRKR